MLLNVLVDWFHYNALVVLPPEHRRFPPVWMWLMIIPIVHTVFIWIISAFKLPASYRSALGENAHRFGSCNQRLGLAWAIVATTLFLPVVDILSFVAYVVLMIIYWQKLNKIQKYLLQKQSLSHWPVIANLCFSSHPLLSRMSIAKLIISIVARFFPGAIFYQPTGEKIIALTIDDAPTPNDPEGKSTDRILAAIAAHNREKASPATPVKATFFLITGHLQPNSTLIERLIAQGHEIANHGTQDLRTSQLAAGAFASQFREANDILSRLTGQAPRWYRPGQAFYNQSMHSFLQKFPGYESRFALASMIPLDTRKGTNHPQFTTWYISQFIFPGAILVLHGGSPERDENTAIVLKNLLAKLHDRGYQVVTLSQLVDHKR